MPKSETPLTRAVAEFTKALEAFTKAGARHSKTDQEHLDQAAQHLVAAGANHKPAKKPMPAKAIPAGVDPAMYAVGEGWDISAAASALAGMAQLASSEIYQEDDTAVANLIAGMRSILAFITGEVAGLEEGMAADAAEDQAEGGEEMPMDGMASVNLDEVLVSFGGEVKALGDGKVGGYLVRFGSEAEPDLSPMRDWFSEKSYFGAHAGDGCDVTINHGVPLSDGRNADERKAFLELADQLLPPMKTRLDKVGLFAETICDLSNEYQAMVYDLASKGKLSWSSGALSHQVKRTAMPNGTHRVDRWIIGEGALTPTPAEPRLGSVVPLKSISGFKAHAPDGAQAAPAQASDGAQVKAAAATTSQPPERTFNMDEKEFKALADNVAALKAQNEELLIELRKPALKTEPAQTKSADADMPFKNVGEQLLAIKAVATNGAGAEMARNKLEVVTKAVKALGANEEVGSDGGFALQPQFLPGIWKRTYDTGILASRCRKQPIGDNSNTLIVNAVAETSRATGSRYGGVQGYWMGAGGTITASRPKLRQIELKTKKLAALMYCTDETLQDTTALSDLANTAVPEELAFLLDDAIWEGIGAGIPIGFVNSPCVVSVAKEAGQASATIVFENLTKMWARLWPRSQANAVWFYNTDAFPQLMSIGLGIGVGGVPAFLPPGGLSGSPFATLFGRPLIPVEFASTVGTVGDLVLADLSQYILATKGDVQSAVSIHVAFTTDETAFRWIMRVDGQPIWDLPLTPFKGSNTQSPFITLATR